MRIDSNEAVAKAHNEPRQSCGMGEAGGVPEIEEMEVQVHWVGSEALESKMTPCAGLFGFKNSRRVLSNVVYSVLPSTGFCNLTTKLVNGGAVWTGTPNRTRHQEHKQANQKI